MKKMTTTMTRKNNPSVQNAVLRYAPLLWGIVALTMGGCSINNAPRPRMGSYATSTPGTTFIDAMQLGNHNYEDFWSENNGIIYTCRGGHLDMAHLRIAADHVRYHYIKTKQLLMKTDRRFTLKLNVDPSVFHVYLTYPEEWKRLPDEMKEQIADDVALELAQHFTFMKTTWHEILTFYGYKTVGLFSEFPSAFSWEDMYSNLLGIRLGTAAVRDTERDFNTAMTVLLNDEMEHLGGQSATTARDAAEAMRGIWFEGNIMVTMKVRYTGIGLDNGIITPMLVPDICPDARPQPYPTPTLATLEKHGFKVRMEVVPKVFEARQILEIVCPGSRCQRVLLPDDLPRIMADVERRANALGCEVVR